MGSINRFWTHRDASAKEEKLRQFSILGSGRCARRSEFAPRKLLQGAVMGCEAEITTE